MLLIVIGPCLTSTVSSKALEPCVGISRKGNCWGNRVTLSWSIIDAMKPEPMRSRIYSNTLKSFTTESAYIPPIIIYHQWIMKCSSKLLNFVSGKVLTHQLIVFMPLTATNATLAFSALVNIFRLLVLIFRPIFRLRV